MKCTHCNNDFPFYEMEPVPIRDKNGNVIRPRQARLVCYKCLWGKLDKKK